MTFTESRLPSARTSLTANYRFSGAEARRKPGFARPIKSNVVRRGLRTGRRLGCLRLDTERVHFSGITLRDSARN